MPLVWLTISPSIDDLIRGNGRAWRNVAEIFGGLSSGYAVIVAASQQRGTLYFPKYLPGAKKEHWLEPEELNQIQIDKAKVVDSAKKSIDEIITIGASESEKHIE